MLKFVWWFVFFSQLFLKDSALPTNKNNTILLSLPSIKVNWTVTRVVIVNSKAQLNPTKHTVILHTLHHPCVCNISHNTRWETVIQKGFSPPEKKRKTDRKKDTFLVLQIDLHIICLGRSSRHMKSDDTNITLQCWGSAYLNLKNDWHNINYPILSLKMKLLYCIDKWSLIAQQGKPEGLLLCTILIHSHLSFTFPENMSIWYVTQLAQVCLLLLTA